MTAEKLRFVDFGVLIPDYEKRFPMEMAVLRIGGVYPGEATQGFVDPYTNLADDDYFGNVGQHCIAVANLSELFASKVLEDDVRIREITSRGLIHDATKRYEVLRKNAVKAGVLDIDDPYSKDAYQTIKPFLEKKGIAPDIVDYMAEAGSETGHPSLPNFVQLVNGKPTLIVDNNIAEMIVHLADDMTFTPIVGVGENALTTYMTFPQRAKESDFENRYPWRFVQGFGFDMYGKIVRVTDVDQSHPELSHLKSDYEWQAWTAKEMSKYLVSFITKDEVADAEEYLKVLANNYLESTN